MVCPFGCVCHAVRAPGAKCTAAAATCELPAGAATWSISTSPVNQSAGPRPVSSVFRVICTAASPPSATLLPALCHEPRDADREEDDSHDAENDHAAMLRDRDTARGGAVPSGHEPTRG
jgi:hypothetical protein